MEKEGQHLIDMVQRQVPDADRDQIARILEENKGDVMAAICALLDAPATPEPRRLAEADVNMAAPDQDTFRYLRETYDAMDRRATVAYEAMRAQTTSQFN